MIGLAISGADTANSVKQAFEFGLGESRTLAAFLPFITDLPVNDAVFTNGELRSDGQMVHNMYLVRVKKPAESQGPWDLYTVIRNIPGSDAFPPLSESTCPFIVGRQSG